MIIKVSFTSEGTHQFSNYNEETTVLEVKNGIKELKKVESIDLIRLIFAGRILQDSQTLQDCNITNNSTFHCVIRKPVAPPPTPSTQEDDHIQTPQTPQIHHIPQLPALQMEVNQLQQLLETLGVDVSGGQLDNLDNADNLNNLVNIEMGTVNQFYQTLQNLGLNTEEIDPSANVQQFTFTYPIGTTNNPEQLYNIINQLTDNITENLNIDTSNNTINIENNNNTTNTNNDTNEYITPEAIESLVNMGFPDNIHLRIALQIGEGNLQIAIEYLLNLNQT